MGDWLDMLIGLAEETRGQYTGDINSDDLADMLERFVEHIREERAARDRATTRVVSLEDQLKAVSKLEALQGWATAVPIGAAAEALRVLADCRRGRQACSLCPVTKCFDNTSPAKAALDDLRVAATDMVIPVPEPGTGTAKLLAANILLRRDRDALRSELADLRRRNALAGIMSSEAVAILQRLHQEEGLDLDGELVFFMARVRVGSGGGCGVCPLRVSVLGGAGASSCGHPDAGIHSFKDVTTSQASAGPPPGWCPFIVETIERSDGGSGEGAAT